MTFCEALHETSQTSTLASHIEFVTELWHKPNDVQTKLAGYFKMCANKEVHRKMDAWRVSSVNNCMSRAGPNILTRTLLRQRQLLFKKIENLQEACIHGQRTTEPYKTNAGVCITHISFPLSLSAHFTLLPWWAPTNQLNFLLCHDLLKH